MSKECEDNLEFLHRMIENGETCAQADIEWQAVDIYH